MPCYYPIKAFKPLIPNGDGRLIFRPPRAGECAFLRVEVPCGQCIGCRLERSRQWALRCMHEASLYSFNSFITLSYSEANLPVFNSLRLRDFQLFMKRLRKKHTGVRFFHCGEYGEDTGRPHYHALLFNMYFADQAFLKTNAQGDRLYTSAELDALWGLGNCWIGSVSFSSAAYVARYCVKKINGPDAEQAYEVVDPVTGEVGRRAPEYATMSRRPGIGAPWYAKFSKEVYPSDFVVRDGMRMRPPKAYDRYLESVDPDAMLEVRARRMREARKHAEDQTPERLAVREEVKLAQVRSLKRGLK